MPAKMNAIRLSALLLAVLTAFPAPSLARKHEDAKPSAAPSNFLFSNISQGVPITSTTLADIASKVAPAVVHINVDKPVPAMRGMPGGGRDGFPFTSPFEGFEFFFNGQRMNPNDHPTIPSIPRFRHNTGSGFIIRPDGYILTNFHVVKNAPKISVTLNDKRTFDNARVVGSDPQSDLAVLKIEASDLPFATMGSSGDIRPGEFVIAVGSPMGFDHTVTFGIVSAVGRVVTDVNSAVRFIQTDAAINPGNSGGPLLNLKGEVVGVNTAIHATAQNIGFSIPVDTAKAILDDLVAGRTPVRPWLGVQMADLTEPYRRSMGLEATVKGVVVSRVYESSPAEKAGLTGGDIILKIDGRDIAEMTDVQQLIREHKIKDMINILVLRNGSHKAIPAQIGIYPTNVMAKNTPTRSDEEE